MLFCKSLKQNFPLSLFNTINQTMQILPDIESLTLILAAHFETELINHPWSEFKDASEAVQCVLCQPNDGSGKAWTSSASWWRAEAFCLDAVFVLHINPLHIHSSYLPAAGCILCNMTAVHSPRLWQLYVSVCTATTAGHLHAQRVSVCSSYSSLEWCFVEQLFWIIHPKHSLKPVKISMSFLCIGLYCGSADKQGCECL